MCLDERSKGLVVINAHRGLFRYNRLPCGISSAPAIFQRTMEALLQGVPKVVVYLYDILIANSSEKEHMVAVEQVLSQLQRAGLRLQLKKCDFFCD